MKRILPKVFGLALVAGAASFILAVVAKLLLGVAFIGLAVFFIKSRFSNRRAAMQHGFGNPRFSQGYLQQQQSPFKSVPVTPFDQRQNNMGIIPIN